MCRFWKSTSCTILQHKPYCDWFAPVHALRSNTSRRLGGDLYWLLSSKLINLICSLALPSNSDPLTLHLLFVPAHSYPCELSPIFPLRWLTLPRKNSPVPIPSKTLMRVQVKTTILPHYELAKFFEGTVAKWRNFNCYGKSLFLAGFSIHSVDFLD